MDGARKAHVPQIAREIPRPHSTSARASVQRPRDSSRGGGMTFEEFLATGHITAFPRITGYGWTQIGR